MFWGILLLAIGGSIIVQSVFGINLPLVRICLGVLVCYLGLNIIFKGFNINLKKKLTLSEVVFGEADFTWPTAKTNKKGQANYSVVFGTGKIDLTNIDLSKGDVKINLDTVFGETTLFINKDTPFVISGDNVFSSTRTPAGSSKGFGKQNLKSPNSESKNKLIIKADTVFGKLRVSHDRLSSNDARNNVKTEPSTI